MKSLVLILMLFFASLALARDYNLKASFICEVILKNKDYVYADHFSNGFITAIPENYFRSITKDVSDTIGTCSHYNLESAVIDKQTKKVTHTYAFYGHKKHIAHIQFVLNNTSRFQSFSISNIDFPEIKLDTWVEIRTHLNSLDGITSLSLVDFSTNVKQEVRSQTKQPIGSAFKLYVLGELADQIENSNRKWLDTIQIKNEWKSLPSGVLQNEPEGTEITLKELANKMISISDNTATDHLIHTLGRENVEQQLLIMNNSFVAENLPFMTTAELFKLKWATPLDQIDQYILKSPQAKLDFLEGPIKETPLSQVGSNGNDFTSPVAINDLEWFASTNDLCKAMQHLNSLANPNVHEALSLNTPFINEKSHWKFAGYKGGSEPGVLTMTFLLQSQKDKWGCLSFAIQNPKNNLNQWIVTDTVAKILKYAEKELNK